MRNITVKWMLMLSLALACSQLVGGEESRIESQDLPGVPEGINLGMSVSDLLKTRPKAEPFDLGSDLGEKPALQPADLGKGSHVLLEEIKRGDLPSVAMYQIRDGRCIALGIEDVYLREEFVNNRAERIRRFVTLLGPNYEKRLMRKGFKGVSYLAPVFLWKGEERSVALTVTSEYPGVTFEWGILQLNVWNKDAEDPETGFERDADLELLATLFAPLEKEIRNARPPGTPAAEQVPAQPQPGP